MKLNCGPSLYERRLAKQEWHRFFTLWPRRVGPGDCRWLEYIERKGRCLSGFGHDLWDWKYRPIDPSGNTGA
jgi:hypothetical protein